MPEHPVNVDAPNSPAARRRDEDLTIPPTHGRAGRGVASILPHLDRQQQINDRGKPAPEIDILLDGDGNPSAV
jgi:hypothetical protein